MDRIQSRFDAVGKLSPADAENFTRWVWDGRHINLFDPDVLTYPRTIIIKACAGDDPLLYVPLQAVFMYDALAPKPGITNRQEAMSLWQIGELVKRMQQDSGICESYFLCRDDSMADFCARNGFEEIKNVRVLRRKLKKEERTWENSISEPTVEGQDTPNAA